MVEIEYTDEYQDNYDKIKSGIFNEVFLKNLYKISQTIFKDLLV